MHGNSKKKINRKPSELVMAKYLITKPLAKTQNKYIFLTVSNNIINQITRFFKNIHI